MGRPGHTASPNLPFSFRARALPTKSPGRSWPQGLSKSQRQGPIHQGFLLRIDHRVRYINGIRLSKPALHLYRLSSAPKAWAASILQYVPPPEGPAGVLLRLLDIYVASRGCRKEINEHSYGVRWAPSPAFITVPPHIDPIKPNGQRPAPDQDLCVLRVLAGP
jgi:hypothetical protein